MAGQHMPRETAILRRMLNSPVLRVQWTAHAREEMANDDLIEADIRSALNGTVVWFETKKDLLWHVEGFDVDRRPVRVVIAPFEAEPRIKVVTAMVLR